MIHAETIIGGAVTGGLIGFFWHPAAALMVMIAGLVVVATTHEPRAS